MSWRRVVWALLLISVSGCGDDSREPASPVNLPPFPPSHPRPGDGSDTASVNVVFLWHCSDPEGDALEYDVFLGDAASPPLVASQHTDTVYDPGPLGYGRTYHWQIVATDACRNKTAGPAWTFRTVENEPPLPPSNPIPAHNARDVPVTTTLCWTTSDPEGGALTFDVYLDTVDPPATKVASDIATASFDPSLAYGTTFHWRVAAKDDHAHETQSDVWSFTTRASATFRFTIRHDPTGAEDFIAVTSDPAVIETARLQLALSPGDRTLHIHGPIERVDGGRNLDWGWQFTPSAWNLVQFSMELCDGNPSWVEAEIDYWVDTIGVFCPWNSYVDEEIP